MSSKNNSGNSGMRSLASSINMEFWLKQLGNFILLDIVLAVCVIAGIFIWWEQQLPAGSEVVERYFTDTQKWTSLTYIIETASGMKTVYRPQSIFDFLRAPAIVIVSTEAMMLFVSLFSARTVRAKLRPLNEVAIKTEELSSMSAQSINLETMEKAVSSFNPALPGSKISTGNKELQSLEIAINNLLERMRESHQQQERFVSDASHELRTPISVIQGYVNMLDRWGKDDETVLKESIEALKNESAHMKKLVEELLFLARGDSGRNSLEVESFDLIEMIKEVHDESLMIDDGHYYSFEKSADALILYADRSMMKQAARILVQNASKYSEEGSVIKLRAGKSGDNAFFSVQDEGMGMEASTVSHVFDRFYRSDDARVRKDGGTGLGLSIAKWIVDAHNGIIEIETVQDIGSRITVKIPLETMSA